MSSVNPSLNPVSGPVTEQTVSQHVVTPPETLPSLGKIEGEIVKNRKTEKTIEQAKKFVFLDLARVSLGTATFSALAVPAGILLAAAAGVLIASNPVGWAIGAAAISLGVIALTVTSVAIYRGKSLQPGDILTPVGIGAATAAIALVILAVILAASQGSGGSFGGGGFGGGGGGSYNMGFFHGMLFYNLMARPTFYPIGFMNCNYSRTIEITVDNAERLTTQQAKDRLKQGVEQNLAPFIGNITASEEDQKVKEGIMHLQKKKIIGDAQILPLNDQQIKKAYDYSAHLVHNKDFEEAFDVLSVLHKQFPHDEKLTKELALIASKTKKLPQKWVARLQMDAIKTDDDPFLVLNLALSLKKLGSHQEALNILGYRYLIAKNENNHDPKNKDFMRQAEKLIQKLKS